MLHFKKDNRIIHEGDLVTGIYFIYEGKVKVHTEGERRQEMIIRLAKSGDILGHRGFEKKNYSISVTALEDTTVCFIDRDSFLDALQNNNNLSYNMLLFMLGELTRSEERMKNIAQKSVGGRVADVLLYMENVFGTNQNGEINVLLSRNDLASLAGTAYETAIRSLQQLQKEKLIALSPHRLKILDHDKLKEFHRLPGNSLHHLSNNN